MDEEIRRMILRLLDEHRIMTVATLRPDGWPQATTVGYVNEGLTLYFLCGLDSQKAKNLARDDPVSLTIDHDTSDPMAIRGLSMAARAQAVNNRAEVEKRLRMLPTKYPDTPRWRCRSRKRSHLDHQVMCRRRAVIESLDPHVVAASNLLDRQRPSTAKTTKVGPRSSISWTK